LTKKGDGMGIHITCSGDLSKTMKFLNRLQNKEYLNILSTYGRRGVDALRDATPKDSGKTADSWYYEIKQDRDATSINWCNSNVNDGVVIALILQYGHGTGTGGYVQGTDYINPAMKAIFDDLANECWKEVTKE
jgi:hypothetical protein